jgi:hypothetical protein
MLDFPEILFFLCAKTESLSLEIGADDESPKMSVDSRKA